MSDAIEADGLVKRYGEMTAPDGLSFCVPQGTVLALLGPNAAGKTTAVRVLTTLLRPDGGHATVAGYDVIRDARRLRAHIGLSGQYAAVDEHHPDRAPGIRCRRAGGRAMNALAMPIADGWTIAKRNTLKIRRSPDLLGAAIMFPMVFVLLFAYVFGSVIDVPGMSYREFLLPGIFVQAVIVGAQTTGYTLTLDLQKGIFDRYRSLPMAPSAVLIGQTVSDLLMNLASLVAMALMG